MICETWLGLLKSKYDTSYILIFLQETQQIELFDSPLSSWPDNFSSCSPFDLSALAHFKKCRKLFHLKNLTCIAEELFVSGRIKGVVLNVLVPGVGFMAQHRWGWGFFYFIIALVLLFPTLGIGYLALGLIGAFHAGVIGDAKHSLSQKDIEKIAAASVAANAAVKETAKDGDQ